MYPLFGGFAVMMWLVTNVPFDCSIYRWRFQAPGVPAMWQYLTIHPHVRQTLWHLVGHVTTFIGDNTWPIHLCYTLVSWHYNVYCYNTNTIGSVMSKWLSTHQIGVSSLYNLCQRFVASNYETYAPVLNQLSVKINSSLVNEHQKYINLTTQNTYIRYWTFTMHHCTIKAGSNNNHYCYHCT